MTLGTTAGFTIALAAATIAATSAGPDTLDSRCSLRISLGAITHDAWLIEVTPLPDSGVATVGDATWARFARYARARPERSWAQRFVVRRVAAPADAGRTLAPGDTILITPWAYEPDCYWVPWRERATRVTDTVGVMRLAPPRTDTEPGAPMTFDVLGWHAPYPSGALLGSRLRGAAARSSWLPAAEYFDFIAGLPRVPADHEGPRPPEAVQAAIRAWRAAHPEHLNTYPVSEIREH